MTTLRVPFLSRYAKTPAPRSSRRAVSRLAFLALGVAAAFLAAPRARGDDAADVREAARAFGLAIAKGDASAARALVAPSDFSDKLVDGMAAETVAGQNFIQALQTKFKEASPRPASPAGAPGAAGPAAAAGSDAPGNSLWVKSIDEAEVKVEGDSATLQPPPLKVPVQRPGPVASTRPAAPAAAPRVINVPMIYLKRVDGRWRTDLSRLAEIKDDPARAALRLAVKAKAYDDTIAEVKEGKYRTPREAQLAVGRKVYVALAGIARADDPTSKPSTPGR